MDGGGASRPAQPPLQRQRRAVPALPAAGLTARGRDCGARERFSWGGPRPARGLLAWLRYRRAPDG